jgi:predicted amidohydrolase
MVFLPEASDFIGRNKEQVHELTKEAEEPFVQDVCRAAKENSIWVSVGIHCEVNAIYREAPVL